MLKLLQRLRMRLFNFLTMKISDLTETPYLHPGEMPQPSNFPNGSISLKAIKRDFTKLYVIIIEGQHVTFFIDKHQNRVLGFVIPTHSTDADRVIPIFSLFFKENTPNIPDLNKTKCLQIDSVFLNKHLRVSALTSQVYFQLAKLGYTIISDTVQFETAQGLWKKLASESTTHGCVVFVADTDFGIFKDADGNKIVYNGTNIKDHEIWTSGSDFDGNYRVLILTSHS